MSVSVSTRGLNGLKVHANELKYSGCTGEIVRKVESLIDKVQVFGKIIESYGKGKKLLSVYIGDSFKNLLCLLEADIGIVLSAAGANQRWTGRLFTAALRISGGIYFALSHLGAVICIIATSSSVIQRWTGRLFTAALRISGGIYFALSHLGDVICIIATSSSVILALPNPLFRTMPEQKSKREAQHIRDGHTFPWNNFLVVWVYDGVDRDGQVPAIQGNETHGVASQCLYNTNLLRGDQVIPIPGKYFMRFLLDYERNICRDDTWILVVAFLREGNLCAFLPTWLDIYGQNLFYRHLFAAHDMQ
nr:bifunctional TH2 protein, mitochondrial isoform X1 [Ipomoea batatas]